MPSAAIVFGFPAAMYFALVAIPLAAIFLYRRRSRMVEVPAVAVWEKVGRPVEVRSFATLLKRLFALLVQLLVVAGVNFALSDPWPAKSKLKRTVIVLDGSATMQTRDGPGGGGAADRMAAAKVRAADVIRDVPPDGEVVVVVAGRTPALASPPTRDAAAAMKAVDAIRALDVEGGLLEAARTASAFVDDPEQDGMVVISDFAAEAPAVLRAGWSGAPERLRLIPVGRDTPAVAVTHLWSEWVPPGGRRVVATLAQHGMTGRVVPVRLSVDDATVARQDVSLADGPAAAVEFHVDAVAPGAVLKVRVDSGDALAVDDVAFQVVPPREVVEVTLVSRGNPPLERAIRADGSLRLRIVAPGDFRAADAKAGVVVIDTPDVPPQPPADAVAAAGYLFVGTADPFGWSESTGWVAAPPVTHWSGDNPAVADLDATVIRAASALALRFRGPVTVDTVVAADAMPLIAERRGPGPRCAYWLFDLASTGLPRSPSFPLLLWNTIDHLAGRSADPAAPVALTGRPLDIAASDGEQQVLSPTGRPLETRRREKILTVSDTAEQGVYTRRVSGGADERFAVNLFSSRGARPLPAGRDEGGGADVTAEVAGRVSGFGDWKRRYTRPSWETVLLAAIAAGLVEWFMFHRRLVRLA